MVATKLLLSVGIGKEENSCAFDLGIITAMANKFGSRSTVTHDDSRPCRKSGGESCTYVISR